MRGNSGQLAGRTEEVGLFVDPVLRQVQRHRRPVEHRRLIEHNHLRFIDRFVDRFVDRLRFVGLERTAFQATAIIGFQDACHRLVCLPAHALGIDYQLPAAVCTAVQKLHGQGQRVVIDRVPDHS